MGQVALGPGLGVAETLSWEVGEVSQLPVSVGIDTDCADIADLTVDVNEYKVNRAKSRALS